MFLVNLDLFEAIGNLALVGGFDCFVDSIALVRGFVQVDGIALVGSVFGDFDFVRGYR